MTIIMPILDLPKFTTLITEDNAFYDSGLYMHSNYESLN